VAGHILTKINPIPGRRYRGRGPDIKKYHERISPFKGKIALKLDMVIEDIEQNLRALYHFEEDVEQYAPVLDRAATFAFSKLQLKKPWKIALTTFSRGHLGVTVPEMETIEIDPTQTNPLKVSYSRRKSLCMTLFHECTHAFQLETGRLAPVDGKPDHTMWLGEERKVYGGNERNDESYEEWSEYRDQPWELEADKGAAILYESFVKIHGREP